MLSFMVTEFIEANNLNASDSVRLFYESSLDPGRPHPRSVLGVRDKSIPAIYQPKWSTKFAIRIRPLNSELLTSTGKAGYLELANI